MNKNELLQEIFNTDFSQLNNGEDVKKAFFAKTLTIDDLRKAHDFLSDITTEIDGKPIGSCIPIGESKGEPYFILLSLLHGNEPAGLAGILYAFALNEAKLLDKAIMCVVGNNLASKQYFKVMETESDQPQQTRDYYRRGLDEAGEPLPDMNRFPAGFEDAEPDNYHARRLQELDYLADHGQGVIDIHSARGNMVCVTDSSNDSLLKGTSIKAILVGLTEAIGSATATSTYKTVAGKKPNIIHQYGIEAGTHEDPNSIKIAAEWTCSMLYSLGLTKVEPLHTSDDNKFYEYRVKEKLNFSDFETSAKIPAGETFITVKDGKEYQYDEMEEVQAGQVVALSSPSGIELSAAYKFSGIFVTKSSKLFNDPAIGLYPVTTEQLDTKFCYPCIVSEISL